MKKKKAIAIGVIAAAAVAIAAAALLSSGKEATFRTATVGRGEVEVTVMATGYIQPVEEVEVGTQVSGVIEKIYVDYNSHVRKGDLLAELDKLTLQERLNQSNASMASTQSELVNARQNFDRVKQLYDAKAATQVSLEDAVNRLSQAETSVANARANVHQAQVNLNYAYIYSPIDGVILERAVNTGQTVASSFNTPTLFRIAEDLTKMQVEADVDEADIGMIREGQKVAFTVDAYNGEVFEGTVSQVRLQPTVTNNVVTYTVIVDAPNPDEKLFPGMTANITVVVRSETGLTLPIEATNFRLTPEIAKKTGRPGAEAVETAPHGKYGVWVRRGDEMEYRVLEAGIDDGVDMIVRSGVEEGEEVVLSAEVGSKKDAKKAAANPLMPRPPGRGRGMR